MARAYSGRSAVISFYGGFHGRTLMGMALTGKLVPYKKGFGAMPAEVIHAPFPHPFHDIPVEPVQGEGGFNVAPKAFLEGLREIADRYGILLILDEIQTGIARTGKMLALEHYGVQPDLVTMAKGLGGGFPLSAVTGRKEIVDAPNPGGLRRHLCGTADLRRRFSCRPGRDRGGKPLCARSRNR